VGNRQIAYLRPKGRLPAQQLPVRLVKGADTGFRAERPGIRQMEVGYQRNVRLRLPAPEGNPLERACGSAHHMVAAPPVKAAAKLEASGAVVVARHSQHGNAQLPRRPGQKMVVERHGPAGGYRPVIDIPGDNHPVHRPLPEKLQQPVDEVGLILQQGKVIQAFPQVPVGGM